MIVRQFLHWIRTASAGERAEATNALARAFLFSDLSPDDRAAAEGAMIMLLDDTSPLVRGALATILAASQKAPPAVIQALAADQPCRSRRYRRDRSVRRAGGGRAPRAAAMRGGRRDRRGGLARGMPR